MSGPAPAKSPEPDAAGPPVVILSDDPTAEDELGGHSRVASAIAALIRQGVESGRSIALTGSWGSGKSSVVKMLWAQLESATKDRPALLLFDAWSYQGDPLRRAFLERFIEHAVRLDPNIDQEKIEWPGRKPESPPITRRQGWTDELDLITGRRESSESRADRPLTGWGLAVAISLLLCLPLGGAFLSKYNPPAYFWNSTFALLFVAAYSIPLIITALAWAVGGFKPDSLKALLLREATQDTSTTTVKTKEPGSVDFQRLFAAIASHLLRDPSRRLVIVIDNLDRIDAAAAVTMWATMRVFFDSDPNPPEWQKRVWLIVPFDRLALTGLWQSPDGKGADFVDSFLNKTFQITFHVSPPVLTRWKEYFQKRVATAFPGAVQARERDAVYEIFALKRTSPSPREINIFINKVSALRMLWSGPEQIELPFLAAYVLHQKEIGADGAGLLLGDVLSQEAAGILTRYLPGCDHGEQLSAAHFNVSPSDAIQVLVDSRFSVALASGNKTALASLRKSANFWTVFERFSKSQLSQWRDPATLVRIAGFLSQSEMEEKEAGPSVSRIWPLALSAAATLPDWGDIAAQDQANLFPLILSKSTDVELGAIAERMLNHLAVQSAKFDAAPPSRDDVNAWIGSLRETTAEILKRPAHTALAENFQVTIKAPTYIAIATASVALDAAGVTLRHLICSAPDAVPAALVATLPGAEEGNFLRIKDALEAALPGGWDAFDTAVVVTLPTLTAEESVTAIRAVLRPRTGRASVESLLPALSPIALLKFAESGFESKGHWREAGVLASAGLLAPLDGPILMQAEAKSYLVSNRSPELLGSMADSLLEFGLASKVLAPDFPSSLAGALLETIAGKGRLDDLDPEAVISFALASVSGETTVLHASKSEKVLRHVLGQTTISFDRYVFYSEWLNALPFTHREEAALHLGPILALQRYAIAANWPTTALLNAIFDGAGVAWLPTGKVSDFMSTMGLASGSTAPLATEAMENLKHHLERRELLGDRTVGQLLEEAENGAPSERDGLRDLAIDRARADYAAAAGDRREQLLAWGEALLARSRRGPWQTAKPFAERAQQIFEMAGRP